MTLDEALRERDSYMATIDGCSDGNCVIRKPKGMHTNGGCQCWRDPMKMQRVCYAFNQFASNVSVVAQSMQEHLE